MEYLIPNWVIVLIIATVVVVLTVAGVAAFLIVRHRQR